jgi:hypothetical protein
MHSATRSGILEIRVSISAWGILSQVSWIQCQVPQVLGRRCKLPISHHVPDVFYRNKSGEREGQDSKVIWN